MNISVQPNVTMEAERWLEEIMEAYGERLTRLAFSYIQDWGKAQEVVQDVFLICYPSMIHTRRWSISKR